MTGVIALCIKMQYSICVTDKWNWSIILTSSIGRMGINSHKKIDDLNPNMAHNCHIIWTSEVTTYHVKWKWQVSWNRINLKYIIFVKNYRTSVYLVYILYFTTILYYFVEKGIQKTISSLSINIMLQYLYNFCYLTLYLLHDYIMIFIFRASVRRCVQCVGDNLGSQAHGLESLCFVYRSCTGRDIQRHHSYQQYGLHWYN